MSKPIPLAPELAEKLAALTLISFDVDGVLTDGRLFYGPEGEMMKAFHVRDGAALKLLAAQGIVVALITGRSSAMVARRAEELGIQHVYQGVAHKPDALAKLVATTGLSPTTMAHVGDDLPDLPLFTRVSVAVSPADGHPLVRAAAQLTTEAAGGSGVAAELAEYVLTARGRWPPEETAAPGSEPSQR